MPLLRSGYNVVPITPGTKFPTIDDWRDTPTTELRLARWLRNGHANDGVGITTGLNPMVDIDVRDVTAARYMQKWVCENIGDAPVRIGDSPKRGMMFRSTVPFAKLSSKAFNDAAGNKCQIEILGDGQQFVAFAIHPDTKKPYFWLGPKTPLTVEPEELPELTAGDGQAIIDEFERYAIERGWKLRPRKQGEMTVLPPSTPTGTEIDEWDLDNKTLGLTDDELRRKVMLIPNEDWDYEGQGLSWLNMMAAIHHETGGSEFGRDLAYEWSVLSGKHTDARFNKTWRSLKDGTERRNVTALFILKFSRPYELIANAEVAKDLVAKFTNAQSNAELTEICTEAKKLQFAPLDFATLTGALKAAFRRLTGQTLGVKDARVMLKYEIPEDEKPEWLEGWVYLTHIDRFFNSESKEMLTRLAFDSLFGRELPADGTIVASKFALDIAKIAVFSMAIYMPSEDETFRLDGRLCINTYSDRNVPKIPAPLSNDDKANIRRARDHIAHLFPEKRDAAIFTSWLAYIAQTRERPNWAIVLQGVEGDGKSFFGSMMAAILGGDNVRMMQAQTLEGQFNAWAEGQMLTFIEEIRLIGHNRHDVLNRIKPLISNDTIEIHPKNINPYNAPNTTAYIASTNFPNALPLNDNDRRYFVLMSQWQDAAKLKEFIDAHPTYYRELYAALDESPGAIRGWLEHFKLSSEFNAKGRAPYSTGRQYMAEMNKSESAIDIAEIIETGLHDDVSADLLVVSRLNAILGDDGMILQGYGLKSALTEAGFQYLGRIMVDGNRESVWTKNPRRWSKNSEIRQSEIRKYLQNIL